MNQLEFVYLKVGPLGLAS